MTVFREMTGRMAHGRRVATERLLLGAVWLLATFESIAAWLGHGLLRGTRGRARAEGVVAMVIMIAFFAALALGIGRLVGPAVTAKVTCTVSILQSSSTNPAAPTC